MKLRLTIPGLVFLLLTNVLNAQIKLPSLLSDNMVLQRNTEVKLWGWASPGEEIKVSGDWFDNIIPVTAGQDSLWMVKIPTGEAGGPHKITLMASNKIELKNILFGEVWICSGQSNMEFSIKRLGGWDHDQFAKDKKTLSGSDYSHVRLFLLKKNTSTQPLDDCEGNWELPELENVENFSAIAWFFGTDIFRSLGVPVGLISTNWGGTPAEAWTSESTLANNPDLWYYSTENLGKRANDDTPSMLFNAMIHPVLNYSIKGAIWYQGESNRNDAIHYRQLFPAMIGDWRKAFDQGDFPFYYVQIAPFNYNEKMRGALIKEAQLMALDVPNTGMVVTSDIGNINNIHPINKQEVGRRLALNALALSYGEDYIEYSGPVYKEMQVRDGDKGKEVILEFDFAESGLNIKGKEATCFKIAGNDRLFVEASARIENNTLIVSSPDIKDPVAVRFGFTNTDEPNLFNGAGLPAGPFRTDDWFINTLLVKIEVEPLKKRGSYKVMLSSSDPSAVIRYTLGGENPQLISKKYKKPFKVKGTTVIKAGSFIDDIVSVNIAEHKISVNLQD